MIGRKTYAGQRVKMPNPKERRNWIMKDNGYIGKIKNGGTQAVKAPVQHTDGKKGVVKTGNDLRTGGK